MSIYKKNWFKYLKNLIIGIGAALVMLGALYKIQSWEGGSLMLTIGLVTEAVIFTILGILPPEKDYYLEKLYPGLDNVDANIAALTEGPVEGNGHVRAINGEVVEGQLSGMLDELQSMSKSLGALKALQEVDFAETSQQIKTMNNFYTKLSEAMSSLYETVDDTKQYKEQMAVLNNNLQSLNQVYGNVLSAMNAPRA
jgi:hypothetical protein